MPCWTAWMTACWPGIPRAGYATSQRAGASRLRLDPDLCLGQPLDRHLLLPRRPQLAIEERGPEPRGGNAGAHRHGRVHRRPGEPQATARSRRGRLFALLHPADRLRAIHRLRQTVPELSALVGDRAPCTAAAPRPPGCQGAGPVFCCRARGGGQGPVGGAIRFGSGTGRRAPRHAPAARRCPAIAWHWS